MKTNRQNQKVMRQIKFRGKRLDSGEWVYGDLLQVCGGYIIYHGSQTESDEFEDDGKTAIYLYKNEVSAVHPDTIGQFTGLLDRNGDEIYEDDILERYNEQGVTMHVNWFGPQFGCIQHWDGVNGEGSWYPLDNYCTEEWEVIGNIHDNPELLNGKQSKS